MDLPRCERREDAEEAMSNLGSACCSESFDGGGTSLLLKGSRVLRDMAVSDLYHRNNVFDFDLDAAPPIAPSATDGLSSSRNSGSALDDNEAEERLGPKKKFRATSWYCECDWKLDHSFDEESKIRDDIRSHFVSRKPVNIVLKYLAVFYDSSFFDHARPPSATLSVRCYITAISGKRGTDGLFESQIHSWIPHDLQPGLQWHPIPGGLYGSEQFMSDCDGCGQRRLYTFLGQAIMPRGCKLRIRSPLTKLRARGRQVLAARYFLISASQPVAAIF